MEVGANCALDDDSTGCGIETGWNEARGSSVDWPAPAHIAECCRLPNSGLRSSHSWQWLIQKVQSLLQLQGSCNVELHFGKRRGCLVEWWQLLLSPSHSNILNVTRPQTNKMQTVPGCASSLCAGQVLFDTVYLLVE